MVSAPRFPCSRSLTVVSLEEENLIIRVLAVSAFDFIGKLTKINLALDSR